jgi:hypothetical protein
MSLVSTGLDPATRERLERSLRALESDRHPNLPLLAGVVVSLMLHGTLLAPRLQRMLSEGHDGVDRTRRADFSVEKEMEKRQARTDEQKQAEDDLLKLGIEDGTTQSTMTWIGYNEYQQHLARLSEVDQAAFRDTDQGGQPMPQARPAPPMVPQVPAPAEAAPAAPDAQTAVAAEPSPPQPMQPPQPARPPQPPPPAQRPPEPARPAEPQPQTPDRREETQPTPPPPPPRTAATEATPPDAKAIQIPEAKKTQVEPTIQPVDKAPENPSDQPPPPDAKDLKDAKQIKTDPSPPAQAVPQPPTPPANPQQPAAQPSDPSQPQPPSPPQQPVPPTQAAPGKTQPSASPQTGPSPDPSARPGAKPGPKADGELSDRESDATSTVNVPPSQWRTGKPLAAKGLKVLTKRPFFDELTSVTTAPRAPLALIEFDREGKAVNCTLLESSGFPNVDQPILDSLYGWRATGKQLEKLQPGETAKFRIRLLLK